MYFQSFIGVKKNYIIENLDNVAPNIRIKDNIIKNTPKANCSLKDTLLYFLILNFPFIRVEILNISRIN